MSRKLLLVLLSGILILSLAACTGASTGGNSSPTQTPSSIEEAQDDSDMDTDESHDDDDDDVVDADMDSEDGHDDSDGDNDAGDDEAAVIDAAAIFSARCSSCHGADREGGGGPPLLPANLTKDHSVYVETITNGSGPMPNWGSKLSVEEINALVEFITSAPK